MIEKEVFYSEVNIANWSSILKNIISNNLKNILRKIKLTKTRSVAVSIWSITFERLKIKISAFRRFVARQLRILVHSWKFKICCIFIGQQTTLSIWPWITTYLWSKFQQFIWIDTLSQPLSNGENHSSLFCSYQKLFKKYPHAFYFEMGNNSFFNVVISYLFSSKYSPFSNIIHIDHSLSLLIFLFL